MTALQPAPAQTRNVICSSCDIQCTVHAKVVDGQVVRIHSSDNPVFRDNICMKAVYAPKGFAHPDRLLYPLKRVGERGSGKFERVSWDEANADIGARLKTVIDAHGPEALAVSTSDWNTSTENGATRRFMNLLGSPNYISGVALCAGNTAAVNRLVYGWFPQPDYANTNCIMLSDSTGHIMGGTRMHPDPKLGVVDQNLKVHGVPNLHIASSSVFPSGGYANPTFTILALAIRLADHIKARRAAGQIAA